MKPFSHYLTEAYQHQWHPAVGDTVSFQINEELEIVAEVDDLTEDGIVLNLDETALDLMSRLDLVDLSEEHDQSHGSAYDRGSADAWYHRPKNPHKMVGNQKVKLTDPADLKAYYAGYEKTAEEEGPWGGKRYDESVSESAGVGVIASKKQARDPRYSTSLTVDVHPGQDQKELAKYNQGRRRAGVLDPSGKITEAEYQGRSVQLGKPMKGDVKKFKVYVKNPKTGNVKKVNFGDKNMEIKRDNPARRKNFRARHGCGTGRASDRTKAAYWSCRMWSSKPVSKIVKELDFHKMTPAERTALRIKQNREIETKAEKEKQSVKDYWKSLQSQVTTCIIDFNIQLSNYIHRNFPQESVYAKLENGYLYIAKPELVASNSHQDLKELGYRQVTDRGIKNSALLQINPMPLRQVLQNDFEMGGRYRLSEKPEIDDYAIGFRAEYVSTVNPSKKEKIQLGTMGFTIAPVYYTAR